MKRKYFRTLVALVLAVSLCLVMAVPASAEAPTIELTAPGAGIDDLTGNPTGSGTEAGVHSIEVTDATASTLTGDAVEGTTDNVSYTLLGTEVLILTIGGTEVTTDNLSATIADNTTLIVAAADIEAKINAATIAPDVDVSVTVTGGAGSQGFLITVDLAGLNNSISSNITGTGATLTGLVNQAPVAGADAGVVDSFTPATGSNGLWQAAEDYGDGTANLTGAHSPDAGTASSLAGLKLLMTEAGALIEGITLVASGDLTAGTAVVTVTEGGASYLEVTGDAIMDTGAENELTVTAYDSTGNQAISYNGTKNLTFSGPAVTPAGTAPTVEAIAVGTVTEVEFVDGISGSANATLIALVAEATTVDVSDGTLDSSFADSDYGLDLFVEGTNLNKAFYKIGDDAAVTVCDNLSNASSIRTDTLEVTVTSGTDTTGITVTLSETEGVNTAIFTGIFPLVEAVPEPGPDQLAVADGDTITVTAVNVPGTTAGVDESAPAFTDNTTADATYYKDGGDIILTVNLDEADLIVTADFSEVDSEYTEGSENVTPAGGTTYTITYGIDAENTVADGPHTITVAAEDAAGNSATAGVFTTSVSVTLDNTGPAVEDAKAEPELIQPITPTLVILSANVTDAGVGVATVTINLLSIDGSATQVMGLDGGLYTYEDDLDVADDGTYVLTITATDTLGNSDNATAISLQVIADTDAPDITSTLVEYPVGGESARVGDAVIITAVVTEDLTSLESVTVDATDLDLSASENLTFTETDTYTYIATATLIVGAEATVGTKTLTITATDLADNEATANVTVVVVAALTAYNLDLVVGWNLISLPLIPDDPSIDVILAGISDNVDQVRTFVYEDDALVEKFWMEGGAVGVLDEMVDGQGYWIQMVVARTLTVQGSEQPGPGGYMPEYDVYEGWNLIGFKSVAPFKAEDYLGTAVMLAFERMYGYDVAAVIYTPIQPDVTELQPGQGYWLAVSADGTIYP